MRRQSSTTLSYMGRATDVCQLGVGNIRRSAAARPWCRLEEEGSNTSNTDDSANGSGEAIACDHTGGGTGLGWRGSGGSRRGGGR